MKISAVLYLIVILAFLMPFFVVSCQKTELITIKGITLVTGGEAKLSMNDMISGLNLDQGKKPDDQKIKAQPLAMASLAIAVIALILVLVLPRKLYVIPVLLSLAGIACLQILKAGMFDAMSFNDTGLDPTIDIKKVLSIKAKFGFWLANLSYLLGGIVAVVGSLWGGQSESYRYQPAQPLGGYEHLRPVPPLEPVNSPLPQEETEVNTDGVEKENTEEDI